MEMMLWNVVLSAILGVMVFMLKGKFDELQRISILLNRTREEVARDHVTREEVQRITEHIDARFNRLEEKIDRLIQKG